MKVCFWLLDPNTHVAFPKSGYPLLELLHVDTLLGDSVSIRAKNRRNQTPVLKMLVALIFPREYLNIPGGLSLPLWGLAHRRQR